MTDTQMFTMAGISILILIGLFIFSTKQKRAHEDKIAKIRADRKALIEKSKQNAAQDS